MFGTDLLARLLMSLLRLIECSLCVVDLSSYRLLYPFWKQPFLGLEFPLKFREFAYRVESRYALAPYVLRPASGPDCGSAVPTYSHP